jgi:ABC-type nitrate/sulfonate/bicarbonate transport system permease component
VTRGGAAAVQLGALAALAGAWLVAGESGRVSFLLLPPLPAVWRALVTLAFSGQLWVAARVTLATVAEAFAIASVLGIAVGFAIGRSAWLVQLLEPVLSGFFAIPITLFLPLFILVFGIGPASKVAYGAAYGFFPIALNTIAGFAALDGHYLRGARAMGANPIQLFRHVYLPGALPIVVTGLRIGFFITVAAVLGGETISSRAGIGRAIAVSGELMESARMYAWVAVVILAVTALNGMVTALELRARRV